MHIQPGTMSLLQPISLGQEVPVQKKDIILDKVNHHYIISVYCYLYIIMHFAISNLIQNAFSRASFILLRCVPLTSRRENVRTGAELFSLITGGIVCSPSPSETSWHSSSRCAHRKNAIQRDQHHNFFLLPHHAYSFQFFSLKNVLLPWTEIQLIFRACFKYKYK